MTGKQHRHCPNCGLALYDNKLDMEHVMFMMCSQECRKQWELKYAAMLLRKDAPASETKVKL